MPIGKGEPWGENGALPQHGRIATSDASASAGLPVDLEPDDFVPVGLVGGDLRTSLGGRSSERQLRQSDATRVTVDVGELTLDDGTVRRFVAHAVARRAGPLGWWLGDIDAYMNASHIGRFDVAPRAHPGDGLLDRVRAHHLAFGQRIQARKRLETGTHVPHPNIEVRRAKCFSDHFGSPRTIYADGVRIGRSRSVNITVLPGALLVVV